MKKTISVKVFLEKSQIFSNKIIKITLSYISGNWLTILPDEEVSKWIRATIQ